MLRIPLNWLSLGLFVSLLCGGLWQASSSVAGSRAADRLLRRGGLEIWLDLKEDHRSSLDFPAAGRYRIPGVVAVNKLPYRCDLHHQDFASERTFAAHLRLVHKLPQRSLRGLLVVNDGQVHFAGDF